MPLYTEEDLNALQLKADVVAVAEELGLDTSGTRKTVTARILAEQPDEVEDEVADEEPAAPAEDSPTTEEEVEEEAETESEGEDDPERARDEGGKYTADDPDTQPDEAYDPPIERAVSAKARLSVTQLVESYYGKAGTTDAMIDDVCAALAKGYQPCVVVGTGNTRFDLKVFPVVFDKADVSKDANRNDGVILNIARRLSHSRLYPSD